MLHKVPIIKQGLHPINLTVGIVALLDHLRGTTAAKESSIPHEKSKISRSITHRKPRAGVNVVHPVSGR
jgi:hypothetical protein